MNQIQGKMVLGFVLTLALSGVCTAETEYNSARYDVILTRSPFGSDPLSTVTTADATAQARKTAAALEQAYRLSYLYESESGEVQAGFQNLKPKKDEPLSSIVMLGESFMGMKLTSVDLTNSEATLLHNGQLVTFQLTKSKAPAQAVPVRSTTSQRRFGGGFRQTTPPKPATPPQPQLTPAEQEKRRAEIRKNLQEYQMEVIRKGMPPLPVPLTQEMDNQLVTEGVLPPTQ